MGACGSSEAAARSTNVEVGDIHTVQVDNIHTVQLVGMGACGSSEAAARSTNVEVGDIHTVQVDNIHTVQLGDIHVHEENRLAAEEERTMQKVDEIVRETLRILGNSGNSANEFVPVNEVNPIIPIYPINFILFSDYKALGRTPRYPDDARICHHFDSINLEETFVIFISHCWLRGWNGAADYDGKPHPDTINHDKYHLTGTYLFTQ